MWCLQLYIGSFHAKEKINERVNAETNQFEFGTKNIQKIFKKNETKQANK